jgi:hypothetical protein
LGSKRDANYYKLRLKKEHPTIHADLLAKRYKSVRQAAAAAGLVKIPGHVGGLKRHWLKATRAEKEEFLAWVKSRVRSRARTPIVDSTGKLSSAAVTFIQTWCSERRLRPGRIMQRLGFSRYDYRLAQALGRESPIEAEILPKLEPWMRGEGFA